MNAERVLKSRRSPTLFNVWHMHNIDSLAMKGDMARMRQAAPFTDALSLVTYTTFVGVTPNSARMVIDCDQGGEL